MRRHTRWMYLHRNRRCSWQWKLVAANGKHCYPRKSALLLAMETGRSEWETLLSQIDEHALLAPGVEGVWSVKQIVAHIAGYEEWAAAFLTDRLDPSAGALGAFDAF